MAISVVMPALELTQESGKLIAWRKKEGERVAKGELLLEVETDKAVVEIESPADGILAGIEVAEGAVVPVGQTIAWIVQPGEAIPSRGSEPTASARKSAEPVRASAAASASASSSTSAATKISPKARRLAKEHGVDLSRVRGSGADGEILAADILAAVGANAPTAAPPASTSAPASTAGTAPGSAIVEPLSTIGRLMAERTTQSWTSVPHFFLVREVDAGAMNAVREKRGPAMEKERGARLSHTDLLVALAARVLEKHPRMNASWTPQGIRLNAEINISVAIAVKDGVTGAVIPKANTLALAEISAQRRDLAERARAGRSRPADIAGGTFTISNLGMYNVDAFTAIISPPQAAILACGRIADRVVAVDGQPAIRPILTLTLSSDHRVVDGAQAAAFLNDLAEAIREPEKLLRF